MAITLGEIAQLVAGELSGDAGTPIHGAAIIRDAQAGDITLADNPQLEPQLRRCAASAVLVPPGFQPPGKPYVSVSHVHDSFAKIVAFFHPPRSRRAIGVSPAAHVADTATIGRDTVVYPGATIADDARLGSRCTIHAGVCILEGVQIGDDVTIFPQAVLHENTVVGHRVIIHAGAVIGAYGFGYQTVQGRHQLSAQLGCVVIEDDVEIGACTTIDRGTYGPTRIGEGTKIDNLVMVAHNCRIGRHNMICSQTGIAGSSTTGDYVVLAGQVGLRDHINIGHNVVLGAKSGAMHDIPDDAVYFGIPATPEREQMQRQVALGKLPAMRKEFKELQRQVAELQRTLRRDAA